MDVIRILSLCLGVMFSGEIMAQNTMRIHYKDGGEHDIPIEQIDSVTFVETAQQHEAGSITGSWLWGKEEAGYYELLTFNDDHTYKGYDNYFKMGFDTQTFGWYSQFGTMLTLQSNGFGYRWMYNWYITALTTNALSVMTKTGAYTYYRLKPEVIHVAYPSGNKALSDGESIVFADGVVVSGEGNTFRALSQGTTYVLLQSASDACIYAYKVVVE